VALSGERAGQRDVRVGRGTRDEANVLGPLSAFLEVAVPSEPFPRSNHREEFWDRVTGKI